MNRPLLSICVATFNRAGFLRVMLEALLPQAAETEEDVEVWILDNGSSDDTPLVVKEAEKLGPFKYQRHPKNLGVILNIVKGASEQATGEYTWIMGDHNLMRPGALQRILTALREHRSTSVFHTNFRCATYPDHWPETALAGFDGPFDYCPFQETADRTVDRWEHLIQADHSALATQVYAPIVKTEIWRDYWRGRPVGPPHTSGLTSYPHTWMLADVWFPRPARFLGTPSITIFNGAQSWGDPATTTAVYSNSLPDLLDLYAERGLSASRMEGAREFCRREALHVFRRFLSVFPRRSLSRALGLFFKTAARHRWLWPVIYRAFVDTGASRLARFLAAGERRGSRLRDYLLRDSRPARWFRSRCR